MSKSKQQGFSDASEKQFLKSRKLVFHCSDCKEYGIAAHQSSKLNEAELINRELVAAGSGTHIALGNLGALLKMKETYKMPLSVEWINSATLTYYIDWI